MLPEKRILLAAAAALAFAVFQLTASGQGHAHIEAGAFASGGGDKLYFANGAFFVTNSGYCEALQWRSSGPYANYHEGSLTFTGLPGTPSSGGPSPNAAPPGTQIRLRFVSVDGPLGGSFGVWDVAGFNFDEDESETLTFSVPVGTTNGTNSMLVSENFGDPGDDPYGHIHGRHYTATLPGLYTVGVQLYDASSNGSGGGPLCEPGDMFHLYFQAGFTNPPFSLSSNSMSFRFGALPNRTYFLESTTNLASPTVWTNITSVAGGKIIRTLTDTDASGSNKFYRVRMFVP